MSRPAAAVLALSLLLCGQAAAGDLPAPPEFGPGPRFSTGFQLHYAAAEAGPLTRQRLRFDTGVEAAVGCGLRWPTCAAGSIGLGAEAHRLSLDDVGVAEQTAGFSGVTLGGALWPVRHVSQGAELLLGLVGRARDLGRDDATGGGLAAGVELRVRQGGTSAAVRVEGLIRPGRGGFSDASGVAIRGHLARCTVACVEVGGGVVALGDEAAPYGRVGIAGSGDTTAARLWVQREFVAAGATTVGAQWRW